MGRLKNQFCAWLVRAKGGYAQSCGSCYHVFWSKNEHEIQDMFVDHAVRDHGASRSKALGSVVNVEVNN